MQGTYICTQILNYPGGEQVIKVELNKLLF